MRLAALALRVAALTAFAAPAALVALVAARATAPAAALELIAPATAALAVAELRRTTLSAVGELASPASIALATSAVAARTTATLVLAVQQVGIEVVRLEPHEGNVAIDELLDVDQKAALIGAHERDGVAVLARATRTADAVHVVFGTIGKVKVDDVVDARHIDAASKHVGRHEDVRLAAAELIERTAARTHRLVGMDGFRLVAIVVQRLREILGAVARAGEHDHALVALLLEHRAKELGLLVLLDRHHVLVDSLGRLTLVRDFHHGGVLEQVAEVLLDGLVDRRREEKRLALVGRSLDDGGHIGKKAHVKHTVRLVEHERLHAGEVDDLALHKVVQAAGRRDEHVGAAADLLDLRAVGRTAEDGRHELPGAARDLHGRESDLLRKLARRRNHEQARRAVVAAVARHAGKDRKQEGCRLASARARSGDEIAAGQNDGNSLLLNGRGLIVAQARNRIEGVIGQAKAGKVFHVRLFSSVATLHRPLRCESVGAPAPSDVHLRLRRAAFQFIGGKNAQLKAVADMRK